MKQLIPFNQSKAGTRPLFCLVNVRQGYGIDPKYGTAWEAWLHTEQHKDRNPPQGLDVPLYYSYTSTIDGVRKNYGHINVRLANGKVWSDGKIYSSITDYETKQAPIYMGWGESVNDVKVISDKIGEAMPTEQEVKYIYQVIYGSAPSAADLKFYTSKPWSRLANKIITVMEAKISSNQNYEVVKETLYRKKV